ncbi:MAG: hypothetical protein WKF52_11140 [Sphingomicrobium sp.]
MTNTRDAATSDRLRRLKAKCGPNKHDQAIALITACILEGLDTGPAIVRALGAIGTHPRHVAIILKEGTGRDPERHRWRRDGEDRYSLHEQEALG